VRAWRRRSRVTQVLLAIVGLLLAGAAAYVAWIWLT